MAQLIPAPKAFPPPARGLGGGTGSCHGRSGTVGEQSGGRRAAVGYGLGRSAVERQRCKNLRLRTCGVLLTMYLLGGVTPGAPPPGAAGQEVPAGSVQGRVRDEGGIPVPMVLVRLFVPGSDVPLRGAESNDLGYYRLDPVPAGRYVLDAGRLGFETQVREIEVQPGQRVDQGFSLRLAAVSVEGITVEAERSRERIRFEEQAGLTVRELAGREIKAIPGLVEADPLRAVDVLPGVVTISDFSSAFNVRGGSADQNLILLDGIPIFNPTHLGGFFSVFNGDLIERAELRSGGFPARFGGRVSSVLEVKTDPGDGRFHMDGGVSLLATRVALGGGLPQGATDGVGFRNVRWRASGRRSYFDQLLGPVLEFPYHLTDLQGVLEGWTAGGSRVSISAYTGRDVLDFTSMDPADFPLRIDWDWGNDLLGVRWIRPRDGGGWWEVRSGVSRFTSGLAFPDFHDTEIRSAIHQASVEGDVEIHLAPSLTLGAGGGLRWLGYDNLVETGGTAFFAGDGEGSEVSGYLQGEWRPGPRWILESGARVDRWVPTRGEDVLVVSPRVSAKRFLPGSQWAVKGAAGRYVQFLHSIRDEELPVGLDVWVLAGEQVPHVVSDQMQAGFEGYLREGWFLSVEGYFREFDGVITTNTGDDPNDPSDDYLPGTGSSYGLDFLLRHTGRGSTGWLAVSLLRARRSFPDPLSGLDPAPLITFPPVFDRRMDVDLVLQRDLGRDMELGVRWNLGTGLPYTRPLGTYPYLSPRVTAGPGLDWDSGEDGPDDAGPGAYGVLLSDRNSARYPLRHRLDVSLRWDLERRWGSMTPYVSILNVYDRRNVLFYFYEYDRDPPVRTGISMFPFLPTVGLEVSF
jgi:hypothetical protein